MHALYLKIIGARERLARAKRVEKEVARVIIKETGVEKARAQETPVAKTQADRRIEDDPRSGVGPPIGKLEEVEVDHKKKRDRRKVVMLVGMMVENGDIVHSHAQIGFQSPSIVMHGKRRSAAGNHLARPGRRVLRRLRRSLHRR